MAYLGWELTDADRSRLLALFPPKYPDVVAHHVTERFGVPEDAPPPEPASFVVVGVTEVPGRLQTLVVSVNGATARSDGETYHVTWSLDRATGAKPMDSKKAIKSHGYSMVERTAFTAEPKTFT